MWGHSVIRYIVCINFLIDIAKWIQSYVLLTETVLISQFSHERVGGWVPDCVIGKIENENLQACQHL